MNPMAVTLAGIVTLARRVAVKPKSPMLVTFVPIVTLVRLVQIENAEFPMVVTLLGIVTPVTLAILANAESPMLVTGRALIWFGMRTRPPDPMYPVMVRS